MAEIFNPFTIAPDFGDESFGAEELASAQEKAFQSYAAVAALKGGGSVFTNHGMALASGGGGKSGPISAPPPPIPPGPKPIQRQRDGQPRGTNAVAVSSPAHNAMTAVTKNTSRGIATTMIVDVGFKNETEREKPFVGKKPGGGGKAKSFDRRGGKGRTDRQHKGRQILPSAGVIRKAVGETPRQLGPTPTPEKRMGAIAGGAQAAVVKLVSTGGGRASVANMIDYNSREAAMALEKENGECVATKADQKAMLDDWEQFFDKREPSRDAVTLTVTLKGEIDVAAAKEALRDIYKDQRFVFGETEDNEGNPQIVMVMSIASTGKGRIKTTDHARDQIATDLENRMGCDGLSLTLHYGEAVHGVYGLTKEFETAAARTAGLSGPRDTFIDATTSDRAAKSWERDLRSYGGRDVMHVVISAKAGTEEKPFVEAVRDFLGHEFAGHRYAFALHGPHDTARDKRTQVSKATDHVHVHAMVVMRSTNGHKLDPSISDFRRWRENMAHLAQERGIDMVATRRVESVNAPNFTKGEHEAVKANVAGELIKRKVDAKQTGAPVMPRTAAGRLAAGQGSAALKALVRDANESGNNIVGIEALRLARRHDAAFADAKIGEIELRKLRDASTVVTALNSIADMVQQDFKGDLDMAQKQVIENSIERAQKLVGKISDSLRGDPALKASFDEKTRPALDAIIGASDPNGNERDLDRAERGRAGQAQAAENAEAYERAARAGGEAATQRENTEKALQFRAVGARAAAQAESAEVNLRASGESTQPIQERAEQVVRSDEYRPSIENSPNTSDENAQKSREHSHTPRKPTKPRTR